MIKLYYIFLLPMVYGMEIKQFDCEQPILSHYDPEFFTNISMKATRLNRFDNTHYFDFNVTIMKALDKEVTITVIIQQRNTILPSANLLELNHRLCDVVDKNNIMTKQFKEAFYRLPKEKRPMPDFKCPLISGRYDFIKMGMPALMLPNNFPVLDGRVTGVFLYKHKVILKVYGICHVK